MSGCGCGRKSKGLGRLAARQTLGPNEWNDAALARNLGAIHPTGSDSVAAFEASGWEAAQAIVELLDPAEYPTIVDFGAGAGRVSAPLATAYQRVIAVDAAPAMVKLGQARCSTCEWLQDDGLDLARLAGPVDAIVSLAVLPHLRYKAGRKVINGLAAALRPGGALAVQLPLYDEVRVPRDWIDVGTWTLDLLTITADQAGLMVEQAHTNPGVFSYDAVGENHGRLHLLRRI